MDPNRKKKIVIIGGGFAGLHAALHLRRTDTQVTLIDRHNHHLFQPLLYQVATGVLASANIASPLRTIFKRAKNIDVLMGEVVGFDLNDKRVFLSDGEIDFDMLVVAAGAENFYFGNPDWAKRSLALKSLEEAAAMRRRIFLAFEKAERYAHARGSHDHAEIDALMTFVVIGGGPTGVELAGAVNEIAKNTLTTDFRAIHPREARVVLLQGCDSLCPMFIHKNLSKAIERTLTKRGVTVMLDTKAVEITDEHVVIERDGQQETIPTRTVLWAAGVKASPLARRLAEASDAKLDHSGRIQVEPDLTLAGQEDVFVIGDMASCPDEEGHPLPGVAPVAIQQGEYVARSIRERIDAEIFDRDRRIKPFRFSDRGAMATIGRFKAVAELGWLRLTGFSAWLMWLFVHLMYLVMFQNRILVLVRWAGNFVTWNRSARLITGENPLPFFPENKDEMVELPEEKPELQEIST